MKQACAARIATEQPDLPSRPAAQDQFEGFGGLMRYNLGCGGRPLPGYENYDRKTGQEIYPLAIPDESADEIRASHVLEHFPHAQIGEIVKHWAGKLKTGGVLKVAVPDFDWCAKTYLDGSQAPIESYVMGGQVDADDFHRALFNAATLTDHFRAANLTDIRRWNADADDCSALPVSLNLRAVKPIKLTAPLRITAVQSLPRTHWTANSRCNEQLMPLGIPLHQFEGVYWGQCLERGMERIVADNADAILTIDYDTVYTAQHIQTLMRLFVLNPHADAITAMQSARGWDTVLATLDLPDGISHDCVPTKLFDADLLKLKTGHFGLTLISASALRGVPKPWFVGVPAPDGTWGEGRVDEDVYFWRNWEKAGKTLYAASRVAVGHLEPMIKWPGRNLGPIHQRMADYWASGEPKEVWK